MEIERVELVKKFAWVRGGIYEHPSTGLVLQLIEDDGKWAVSNLGSGKFFCADVAEITSILANYTYRPAAKLVIPKEGASC